MLGMPLAHSQLWTDTSLLRSSRWNYVALITRRLLLLLLVVTQTSLLGAVLKILATLDPGVPLSQRN